jgi:hypothetical protein
MHVGQRTYCVLPPPPIYSYQSAYRRRHSQCVRVAHPGSLQEDMHQAPEESQQQFEQDQFGCHQWAQGQTGIDPTRSQQSAYAPPPERGGIVRGAASAIGGNAGKGAAIGAGVGAATGLLRQGRRNQQAAQAQQQAQAQAQAGLSNYDRAYAACMQGRGCQIR